MVTGAAMKVAMVIAIRLGFVVEDAGALVGGVVLVVSINFMVSVCVSIV